ncbi:hypothetical protein D1007_16257 [Hordeum vulgare]|nr:hypothetical protein D1007_16257 [Hordeum vulgare]
MRTHRSRPFLAIKAESRLVKPKKEPMIVVKPKKEPATVVKQEHVEMATHLNASLAWSRNDYVREEMERQRHALEKIAEQHRDRDEDDIFVLSDSDEEATTPTKPVRSGDPRQGCSKDGGVEDEPPSDADGGDDGDYTVFYNLLGMN